MSREAEDDLLWSDVCLDNLLHVSDIAKLWQDATPDGVGKVVWEGDIFCYRCRFYGNVLSILNVIIFRQFLGFFMCWSEYIF